MSQFLRDIAVDPDGPTPLYLQVEKAVETSIRENGLKPGDQIPSPSSLAKTLPVSELTVRRAIRRLVRRNILVTRQGRGTFLANGASLAKVLWVCGADFLGGDITPYLIDHLAASRRECERRGQSLEPVWLGDQNTDRVQSFCSPQTARDYRGLMFVRCRDEHPLFVYACENNIPHVYATGHLKWLGKPRTAGSDLRQAIELGLKVLANRGHSRITLLAVAAAREMFEQVLPASGLAVELFELPQHARVSQVESQSYEFMRRLVAEGRVHRGVFMMDDIVARGATRAMLDTAVTASGQVDVVVRCGKQEMIPFGLPVTYVVDDTEEQARQAVRILADQAEGRTDRADHYVSEYRVVSGPPEAIQVREPEQVVFSG